MSKPSLYVCARYEGGMRDFHLSLMHEAVAAGECPISVVRLTRAAKRADILDEHARHGVERVYILSTTAWWLKQLVKLIPVFAIWAYWLRWRCAVQRMVITGEGFCFGLVPAFAAKWSEIFYHDPDPHESSDQSAKVAWENAYKARVHETKPWRAVLIGAAEYQDGLAARTRAPVQLIPFPRFTKHLFPTGHPPAELNGQTGYILLYGRVDRYKGIYDWLTDQSPYLDQLPPIVVAGRIIDDRVLAFSDRVTLIDRFILNEEVAALFSGARAVVLPYHSVTHSGIGDIAMSFGKPTYLPELPYFLDRYGTDPLMCRVGEFRRDMGIDHVATSPKTAPQT